MSYKIIEELFEAKHYGLIQSVRAAKCGSIQIVFAKNIKEQKIHALKDHITKDKIPLVIPRIEILTDMRNGKYDEILILTIENGASSAQDFIEFRNSNDLINFITRKTKI